jgi:prevent-host-death family protein
MKQVTYGVREFQAKLGEALRAAQRGEQVLITSRGRAVAVLGRADADNPAESDVDRKLRRLAAQGKIRLGRRGRIPPFAVPRTRGLSNQLRADRR